MVLELEDVNEGLVREWREYLERRDTIESVLAQVLGAEGSPYTRLIGPGVVALSLDSLAAVLVDLVE